MKENPLIAQNTVVVVMGLGVSGIAAVRYLHAQGARVLVSDTRLESQLSVEEKYVLAEYCEEFEGGGHSAEFLRKSDLIFLSPGIPADLDVVEKARKNGSLVIGELALAAPVLQCKVVAITGTNGKTTVTTLIGEFLRASGRNVFVCGNIGRPLLDCLMTDQQPDVAVVEVSSFQLENAGEFRPDVAVLLNITPDHLDRHGSFAEYIRAKAQIFVHQKQEDIAILSSDDTICIELSAHLQGVRKVLFGHSKDCDGYICDSEIYVRSSGSIERFDLAGTIFDNNIGKQNCAAAILAASSVGAYKKGIMEIIHSFLALPHRMELVDVLADVTYYNDSKATNTGAVMSALQQAPGKVVLIMGGRDKGDNYSLLRDTVKQRVRQLILLGEAAPLITDQLQGAVTIDYADDMEDAVRKASRIARSGDSVLLSPGCASFDMFKSYGHRGQVFRESVEKLKSTMQNGEVLDR